MATNDATKAKILFLLYGLIPEAIFEAVLVPLQPFVVRHLRPNEDELSVGHYSGLLGSAFYLPLFLMNLVWGAASDRYGRKPILIIGIVVTALTTIVFGFSQNYWVSLGCRFIAGMFGANSTVSKGYIGDLARDQRSRAWGYAMYGSIYGTAGILGPLIGGLLANPAQLYPNTFSQDGFFAKYPFMLICMLVVIMCVFGLISILVYLKEDAADVYDQLDEIQLDEDLPSASKPFEGEPRSRRKTKIDAEDAEVGEFAMYETSKREHFKFISWNTLGPIFLYCTIAYTNMTYLTAVPLFFSAAKDDGGLGLNSRETSLSFTTLSATKLMVQLLLFDRILLRIGDARKTFHLGMLIYLPNHLLIPFLSVVSESTQTLLTVIIMFSFGVCESLGYLSVILMITESQQAQNLGIAHGLASTFSALARTISPTISGSLWTYGVMLGWPWVVFFVGGTCALMGAISSSESI